MSFAATAIAAAHTLAPSRPPPVIRATRKALQWSTAIHRAYAYISGRLAPAHQAGLDAFYEKTLGEGPDFLKVRRDLSPCP
jgi:hypothetical protein